MIKLDIHVPSILAGVNVHHGRAHTDFGVSSVLKGSLDKLPIYAAIGVPEIWRYDGHAVMLVIFQEGAYVERGESVAFPKLTRQVLSRFMEQSKQQERTAWLRSVRAWAHQLSVSEA
jgi:hypothetical protein